uniref:Transposase n=1 Tax=Panagrolaimus sp. JU765 TaxID=591449 RepID=A0AC34QLD3_9BILA
MVSNRKHLSLDMKTAIVQALKDGKTQEQVSKDFHVSRSTVRNVFLRFKANGHVKRKIGSGRPKLTTVREDRALKRMSVDNPRLNAVQLNQDFNDMFDKNISVSTTKRRLKACGLNGRRPAKKPYVSMKNRKARLDFAREHLNWGIHDWQKVIWSDESKFLLFGSDGISYVRRPVNERFNPKYQIPTVKHGGGSIMVWGCFTRSGVGPLHKVEGIMDQFQYRDILEKQMLPFARAKKIRGWLFQQDNDPKHTSKTVKDYFKSKKIRVLSWPSQSPDLNPIEHLWEILDRRCRGKNVSNIEQKLKLLQEEWYNIPKSVLEQLVDSMPRRCQAVIESKGFPTKY